MDRLWPLTKRSSFVYTSVHKSVHTSIHTYTYIRARISRHFISRSREEGERGEREEEERREEENTRCSCYIIRMES